jgi:hypothetical protein
MQRPPSAIRQLQKARGQFFDQKARQQPRPSGARTGNPREVLAQNRKAARNGGIAVFLIYIQDIKTGVGGVTFGWSLYFLCLEYFRFDL